MPLLVLAFCVGAASVQLLPTLPPPAVLLLPATAALLVWRRHAVIAALVAGFVWTVLTAAARLSGDWPCARDRERIDLTGVVAAPPTLREGRVDFDLQPALPLMPGQGGAKLRLSWYQPTRTPLPGQRWRMTVLLRCRNGMSNAGAPDRELDLLRQGIAATGYLVSGTAPVLLADEPWRFPVQRLRARMASDIAAVLPSRASAAVLQGLSVGVRGSVPEALWEAFAATGTAHLMAISGLHVTGCALLALLLLRAAWRLPGIGQLRARVALEMAVVVIVTSAYAALAGGSLPTLRTLAMVGIVAWQRVLRRALPVHATFALGALILVAADPFAMTSPGFWLSFVATAVLLAMVEAGPGWHARLAAFLRTQAAIFVLLAPVLAATFGRLSLIAPLVNAAAIPVFTFVLLPSVLFATGSALLAPDVAVCIWRVLGAALDATWPWLQAAGRLPGATWSPAAQPLPLLLAALMLAFGSLLAPMRGLRIAAAAVLLGLVLGRSERPASYAWKLTVLDVGQGLAAVVQTRRHALVFDTGPRWRTGPAAARVSLLPWLRAAGIRTIDRMIISHADIDHSGGTSLLRDSLQVMQIMAGPGATSAGTTAVCERGVRWRWDGVDFRVLHPAAGANGSDNDSSCALMVAGRGGSALLLADPESEAETSLLSQALASDVVLLPHHGSRTSSSQRLVAAVRARLGIVSAGLGNRWGMPDATVVARWRAAGTSVLNTADTGAVTVRFGMRSSAIEVRAQRLETRRWWHRKPPA
ncbi:MAG TPA: DNA internalization-related competence protein ComEC/Rec2 [Steroidobacteraceae bacterium]|nr:DNA internalization-related competence protein ComEC/Rec2 [Steroidobacteraceae bacterium]